MAFAAVLQKLRSDAGLTQDQVAKYVGVGRQQVGRWENKEQKPVQRQMQQLASLFNKTIRQLEGKDPLDDADPVPLSEIKTQLKAMIDLLDRPDILDMYGLAAARMQSAAELGMLSTRLSTFRSADDFPKGRIGR